MLILTDVRKSFGAREVLRGVSFEVAPGQIFGFVGANGSGKTTTMRIILDLLTMDGGTVEWNGHEIDAAARERIGYMPEERGLYPKAKVGEQLVYFAKLHGLSTRAATERMEYWTERLGVAERRGDAVQKLSLGNQQRVQLAASLVHDPGLLILDEPFSGLDPVAVDVMSEVLRERADAGAPVIFSSHQLDLLERLCDRAGILAGGVIQASGTIGELRASGGSTLELSVVTREPGLVDELARAGFEVSREPGGERSSSVRIPGAETFLVRDTTSANPEPKRVQEVLRTAQRFGEVYSFAPRFPHLTDLFRDAVADSSPKPQPAPTQSPAPRPLAAQPAGQSAAR